MCQTNRMNVGRSLFFSPCIVTVILMQCAPLFPKPLSNYTNTQQGISAPPSTSLSPPLLLWCYGQQGPLHRVALMSKCRVCVLLFIYLFFHITVKSVFVCRAECCCNMERKHRLTPPCEHTPTFQPEQSRIKKEVCAARESPDSCLVLPILLPAPLIHPSPLTSYSPAACRLEKTRQ